MASHAATDVGKSLSVHLIVGIENKVDFVDGGKSDERAGSVRDGAGAGWRCKSWR